MAREVLAHVGRGPPVHGRALEHQLGPLRAFGAAGEHDVGPEAGAHHRRQLAEPVVARRAHERHLLHRREVEVHRAEQVREGVGMAARGPMQEAEHSHRMPFVLVLAGDRSEPQEAVCGR